MKTIFKTINLLLLGIFVMPSFLLLFATSTDKATYGYYCDSTYFETGTATYTNVYIEYDTYTKTDTLMERSVPLYENETQLNSCAPMAATIVLGYYDVIYENLFPDISVGMWYNGKFYYSSFSSEMRAIKESLYYTMGTNTEAPGTSIAQFMNGFTTYVNQQGYNISFTSCGNINYTTLLNYINMQQPIVVFCNSYRYFTDGQLSDDGTKLGFLEKSSSNGHVAVCYGLREYTFTKDGTTWTEKYLAVSFGDGSFGLLDVNDLSKIDATYAVNIYSN